MTTDQKGVVLVHNQYSGPSPRTVPSALAQMDEILHTMHGRQGAVFLDYDGTLTPIVSRPEQATLSPRMKDTIQTLARGCVVAIISGRDLDDVRGCVGIEGILYAGSHGFDIAGPDGLRKQQGIDFLPSLKNAEQSLRDRLNELPGVQLERKEFSIAVHYRNVPASKVIDVANIFGRIAKAYPELKTSHGLMVFELLPGIDWDKGKAILWILDALHLDRPEVLPLYIGDDTTDEDAFRVLRNQGIGIVVAESSRETAARYLLRDPEEVHEFLNRIAKAVEGGPLVNKGNK